MAINFIYSHVTGQSILTFKFELDTATYKKNRQANAYDTCSPHQIKS